MTSPHTNTPDAGPGAPLPLERPRTFDMDGTVVFITGATRGIGGATVRRLTSAGAKVGFTYRPAPVNVERSADLIAGLDDPGLGFAVPADVADEAQMRDAAEVVAEHFGGPIDVGIANAADTSKIPWTTISVEEWDRVLATNLRGTFITARVVAEGMRRQGRGKIITVGSVMATLGDPRALHYVSSKGGIVAFTRSLARAEGTNGIRVNCVIPGAIQVEKEADQGSDAAAVLEWMKQVQCLPYRGQPDDIAAAMHFLASPGSDFMTGQVITVDGGWTHY